MPGIDTIRPETLRRNIVVGGRVVIAPCEATAESLPGYCMGTLSGLVMLMGLPEVIIGVKEKAPFY